MAEYMKRTYEQNYQRLRPSFSTSVGLCICFLSLFFIYFMGHCKLPMRRKLGIEQCLTTGQQDCNSGKTTWRLEQIAFLLLKLRPRFFPYSQQNKGDQLATQDNCQTESLCDTLNKVYNFKNFSVVITKKEITSPNHLNTVGNIKTNAPSNGKKSTYGSQDKSSKINRVVYCS